MLPMETEKFERVPLAADRNGTLRVAGTRVTLHSVVALFEQGATPEQIAQCFPGLDLGDVYAVITFYIRNRDGVRAHLEEEDREAEALRERIQAEFPDNDLRERLLRIRRQKEQGGR